MRKKHLLMLTLLLFGAIGHFVPFLNASEPSTYALSFDGIDDYVNIPHDDSLNFGSNNFTISLWLKFPVDYAPDDFVGIIGKNYWAQYWDIHFEGFEEPKRIAFYMIDTEWNGIELDSVNPCDDGAWHNVVLIRGNDNFTFYIDGVFDVTYATFMGSADNDETIYIGKLDAGFLDGCIDDVCIYNRAINTTEISYAYNSGLGRYSPLNTTSLVAYWKFDEGVGTTLYDKSDNDNHGTITGATWTSGVCSEWYDVEIDDLYIQDDYLGTVSQITVSGYSMSFLVSGSTGNTSIIKVGSQSYGKPQKVEGVNEWTWDPSGFTTLTVTFQSSVNVSMTWSGGSSSSFRLRVHVTKNKVPYMGANVNVDDGENVTTDIFGDAYFDVSVGSCDITVYLEDKVKRKTIPFISGDLSVGFDFDIPVPTDRSIYVIVSIPLVFLVVVGVSVFLWRRKQ